MKNSQYEVQILVGGRRVREYQHQVNGEWRTFIEAKYGSNYEIRVKNNSNKKVLALCSVDGLSVVSGKITDGYKGRGYIIQPRSSVTIKGFRESDNTVGSFEFTEKENSYAAEQGAERNVGVIACNIIDEKPQPKPVMVKTIIEHHHHHHDIPKPTPWPTYPSPKPMWGDLTVVGTGSTAGDSTTYRCCSNNLSDAAPIASSNFMSVTSSAGGHMKKAASFDAGTTWGERVNDKIQRAHFDKNEIVANFSIYYATREGLESLGIVFSNAINLPKGFGGEYCKPPRKWNKNLPCRPDGGRDGSGYMM